MVKISGQYKKGGRKIGLEKGNRIYKDLTVRGILAYVTNRMEISISEIQCVLGAVVQRFRQSVAHHKVLFSIYME